MDNKIVICNNKKCQLITEDKNVYSTLKKFLSFRQAGVEYTAAYQNGWDGITYLITPKGFFNSGLLERVKDFLKSKEITFSIEDKRKAPTVEAPINILQKLQQLNLSPRDYQERIAEACFNNTKGIVRACTGSGKTLCTALITARINKPTIIYVIGLDLLKQFHDLFSSIFEEEIGFIGNGVCNIKRINIASIWTIGRALSSKDIFIADLEESEDEVYDESHKQKILNLLQQTKLHIFDECHVVTCDTIKNIYDKIDPEHIYGFSGTPFRDDNSDLLINGILGEQIIEVNASELISKNVLAQPIIKFVAIPSMSGISTAPYQSVYKMYITENDVRNAIIVKQIQELISKNYSPLVLFKHIKHGSVLFEHLQNAGIECAMLYGNDSLDRRTEVKQLYNEGKLRVILASTIFDIGIDIPKLNSLVLCGGGKSSIKALQRIGRVIRSFPGKKVAAIVDFYDQVKFLKKHSQIRYNLYSLEKGFKVIKCKEMK